MGLEVRVLDDFRRDAARLIAGSGGAGPLVLTGGGTAAAVYEPLAEMGLPRDLRVLMSDERSVPPDHPDSNHRMLEERLAGPAGLTNVARIRGEDDPEVGASRYAEEVADDLPRITLQVLGMGADCHVAAVFPGSPTFDSDALVAAVERPDGLNGVTLTPRALRRPLQTYVIVSGSDKAAAVARAVAGEEDPRACPVLLLERATLLLDKAAAAHL